MIYALSDLHLTFQVEKPMDVFGSSWENYVERMEKNWRERVKETDTVLIPGDVSWATYLEQAEKDFRFIDSLPGTKYISKGNHDYWWETVTKMNAFLDAHKFSTLHFVHNSAFEAENAVVCATKGFDKDTEERLKNRELIRLENSILAGKKLSEEKPIIVMLHYPPFYKNGAPITEITEMLEKYEVKTTIFGHIHNDNHACPINEVRGGVHYMLVSCDRIDFSPVRVAINEKLCYNTD